MNYQFIPVIFMLLVLAISPSSLAFSSTSSNSAGDKNDFLNIREATIGADPDEMSAFLETHEQKPFDLYCIDNCNCNHGPYKERRLVMLYWH